MEQKVCALISNMIRLSACTLNRLHCCSRLLVECAIILYNTCDYYNENVYYPEIITMKFMCGEWELCMFHSLRRSKMRTAHIVPIKHEIFSRCNSSLGLFCYYCCVFFSFIHFIERLSNWMCATSWNVKPIWINAIKSNEEVNEGRVERKKKNLMKLNHIENYCVRKMAQMHTHTHTHMPMPTLMFSYCCVRTTNNTMKPLGSRPELAMRATRELVFSLHAKSLVFIRFHF